MKVVNRWNGFLIWIELWNILECSVCIVSFRLRVREVGSAVERGVVGRFERVGNIFELRRVWGEVGVRSGPRSLEGREERRIFDTACTAITRTVPRTRSHEPAALWFEDGVMLVSAEFIAPMLDNMSANFGWMPLCRVLIFWNLNFWRLLWLFCQI